MPISPSPTGSATSSSGTGPDRITPEVRAFLGARDSFYLATVSESGWPYVQFRGGPPGFLKVRDDSTIGWADFQGNPLYISTGNVAGDNRVALIVMDHPHITPRYSVADLEPHLGMLRNRIAELGRRHTPSPGYRDGPPTPCGSLRRASGWPP